MSYQTFTANQRLTSTQMNNLQASVYTKPRVTQSGSSYTLQLSDKGSIIEFTNSSTITVTIPLISSVDFPDGTNIEIINAGTGTINLVAPSGLTLNSEGGITSISGQWSSAVLTKRLSDNWILRSFSSKVQTSEIEDLAVTTEKIANNAITTAKILDGAITVNKLADVVLTTSAVNYVAPLGDKNKIVEMNLSVANTVTIPADSATNFPVGSQFTVVQYGTGKTQIVGSSGVNILATPGVYLRARYSSATIIKRASNEWYVFGDLSAT